MSDPESHSVPAKAPLETQPLDTAFRARVTGHLDRFARRPLDDRALTPAAVAVILTEDEEGEASFVITRRAKGLRRHSGQWALPGGRADEGEDAITTALRETREEIGLRLARADVLGLLDDYETRSGFRITPVVCWGGPAPRFEPDPREVAHVYRVAVRDLYRPGVPQLRRIPESAHPLITLPILDTNIHAPTAAILYQLREVALSGRATRVGHFEQPRFAWK